MPLFLIYSNLRQCFSKNRTKEWTFGVKMSLLIIIRRKKKLQTIGKIRWWVKYNATTKIFGEYKAFSSALYVEVIISLLKIEDNVEFVADVRAKARNLKESLLKYETILLAQIFSVYLTSPSPCRSIFRLKILTY